MKSRAGVLAATTRLAFVAAISTLARGSHPVPPLAPHQLLSSAAGLASPLRHEQQLLNHRLPHSLATALAGPSFAGVGASSGVGLRMQQSMGGEEGDGGRRAWAGESEQLDLLRDKGFKKGDRVILYDGVCNMCNGWVTYVLRNNKKGDFKFAALQGDSGRALLTWMGRRPDDLSTLVLLESDETVYIKSEAVLRVLGSCGGITGAAAALVRRLVPVRVRDWIYSDIVAPNRYKVFGKIQSGESCRRITPDKRKRFLD